MKKYFVYDSKTKELYAIHINSKNEAERICDDLNSKWFTFNKYKIGESFTDRGMTVELNPNFKEFWE